MPSILIIDDHEMLLEVMQLALEDEYLVHTARSGEEALGMLELLDVDIVITDLNMAGMSGLELVKRITLMGKTDFADLKADFVPEERAQADDTVGVDLCVRPNNKCVESTNQHDDHFVNPRGRHAGPPLQRRRSKIILYSAMLTPGLIAYAKGMGIAACLPKPFELEELRNTITRILNTDYTD